MTPQEALEIITNAVQTDKMTAEQDKALAIAQQALEKQIPKKPYIPFSSITKTRRCPVCHEPIIVTETFFCRNCGQALDWSDTNDR